MRLGIFARTFERPTLDGILDVVAATGLQSVQFNLSCAGLATMPGSLDRAQCAAIRGAFTARGLEMAAISGTFNMAHPDAAVRRDGLRRLAVLAAHCEHLGTAVISLCSGTRDPANMWRCHEDNRTTRAWRDMAESMAQAAKVGETHGVIMAFEPEVANVVDSARRARLLLDEVGSPYLKVVLDAANLFHAGDLARQDEVLDEACDLLSGDIVLAHAKDLSRDGAAGGEAAGTGRLNYERYLASLRAGGYDGPLILHGLREEQVPASIAFLRDQLTHLQRRGERFSKAGA